MVKKIGKNGKNIFFSRIFSCRATKDLNLKKNGNFTVPLSIKHDIFGGMKCVPPDLIGLRTFHRASENYAGRISQSRT